MEGGRTVGSSEEPEVLLPPGADEVPADALALLPHRQRQALRLVDALLHELLAAAPHEAAKLFQNSDTHVCICSTHDRKKSNQLTQFPHDTTTLLHCVIFSST